MTILSKLKNNSWFVGLGVAVTGLASLRWWLLATSSSTVPTFCYPRDKYENYVVVTKNIKSAQLPAVFWAKGFYPFNMAPLLIIADFETMQKAFRNPVVCNRMTNHKTRTDWDNEITRFKIDKLVNDELQLETHHNTLENSGVGGGSYDKNHRTLRQRWYQTTTKLITSAKLREHADFAARQIVANIEREMEQNGNNGIDPRSTFMSGTLNVATSFMLSDRLEFGDLEQTRIMKWIENSIDNFTSLQIISIWVHLFPDWMIRWNIPRKLLELLRPGSYKTRDMIYGELVPFILTKIKEHEITLDEENPRDFLDFLILENRQNHDIGYSSIALSMWQLYVGAGDTLTQTMRWMSLILSLYTDVQERCFDELDRCYDQYQQYREDACPYLCATLDEIFRFRPIGDSLPHLTSEPVDIGGHLILPGTMVRGSFTAIMHDPANFDSPNQFNPSRFIDDNGRFVRDPRVCIFSTGLRNCIGKKLAQVEFFSFAAHIIHRFRLVHVNGNLTPTAHNLLLKAGDFRVKFMSR